LHQFNQKQLKELLKYSPVSVINPALTEFCKSRKIVEYNAAEFSMLQAQIVKKRNEELTTVEDVHGHLLATKNNYYSEKGLVIETPTETEVVKTVLKPQPWIVPQGVVKEFPGIQYIIGVTLACLSNTKNGLVINKEDKFYSLVPGLDQAGLMYFANIVKDTLEGFFATTQFHGNGRIFIQQLFDAFAAIGKEGYLMMHLMLARGPLAHCFNWGILQSNGTITSAIFNRHQQANWVVTAIKSDYSNCFVNAAKAPGAEQVQQNFPFGKLLPLFVNALPLKPIVPRIDSMDKATEFMQACRAQRQSDEKGLSAYSGGYGACGNPTKAQLRFQKLLTLILGSLFVLEQGKRLVIFNEKKSENEYLDKLIQHWQLHCETIRHKTYVFHMSTTQILGARIDSSRFTTSEKVIKGDRVLILTNVAPVSTKKGSWSFTDNTVKANLETMMGTTVEGADESGIHITLLMPIQSETIFRTQPNDTVKEKPTGFFVYALGSLHNMHGVVSTEAFLPVATSDGTSLYQLALKKKVPLKIKEFYDRVVANNLGRSLFYLAPKYYFSPELNVLRRLPGKTFDWLELKLESDGIDIQNDLTTMSDFSSLGEDIQQAVATTGVASIEQ